MVTIWTVVLVSSLIALVGFGRAGSILFWKSHEPDPDAAVDEPGSAQPRKGPVPIKLETDEHIQDAADSASPALAFAAVGLLIAGLVAITLAAGPVTANLQRTADQLFDTGAYVDAVLVRQEDAR